MTSESNDSKKEWSSPEIVELDVPTRTLGGPMDMMDETIMSRPTAPPSSN